MKDEMILDRHGNRIRIFVKNDDGIRELTRSQLDFIIDKSIKKEPHLFIPYLLNIKDILKILKSKNEKGSEIRKIVLRKMLKMKKEPKYIILEMNNKRINLLYNISIFLVIRQIFLDDQYDTHSSKIKGKVVIDVGANVGVFSIYTTIIGAKKVYAFEPVPETYNILKKNIKLNNLENLIIPINKGLGEKDENKIIYFNSSGDIGATLNFSKLKYLKEKENKINVLVTTLDKFIKQNKIPRVDFIKMDVEGYEENVLLGAKETIKKWKPILSFSAYHLPTDKERLPQIVKSIRPDYKIKLNKFAEEDFYCW
ncbi:MAG: FkbM family methyltransferase [Nitrososphaerota archaeon]